MPYLFILFIVTPIVELWLILKVGSFIGVGSTLGLIFLTAIIGTALLRQQGFSTLFRARQKMEEGELPASEMVEGLMLAFAGALMLTPGFVTDGIGFALLVPVIRKAIIRNFQGKFIFSASSERRFGSDYKDEDIIDGEFTRDHEKDDKKLL